MSLERRRTFRHRIQTPAYAGVLGNSGGVITDASESGIAIQGISALPVASEVSLRLDLLETRTIVEAEARVAWSDRLGRSGLEFHELTPESRRQIQQWLLVNALSQWAGAPQAQRAEAPAVEPAPMTVPTIDEELAQAAENALTATGAEGAVVALLTGSGDAACVASAGKLAPPPGTRLDNRSGISGACLRSGRLMRCDDAATDPRVDAQSCRDLGIGSVAAAPVLLAGKVAGLVEIFSSRPHAFSDDGCSTLQALAASVAVSVQMHRTMHGAAAEPAVEASPAPSPERQSPAPRPPVPQARTSSAEIAAPGAPVPETRAGADKGGTVGAATPVPAPIRTQEPFASAASQGAESNPSPAPQEVAGTKARALPNPDTSPDPATLASEFGAPSLSQPEERLDSRRRMLLILPVAGLLLLGVGFLVRGGNSASVAQPAPAAAPETPAAETPRHKLPKLALADVRARAERGDANAEFELGAKYASGEDLPQNYDEAVKWFTQAADQGHVLAAATLGAFYWAGRGLPQDYLSAYMWSAIAKEGGDEASKYRVAILGSRMTPSEVNEAQRRATAWLQHHPQFVASKASPGPPQ